MTELYRSFSGGVYTVLCMQYPHHDPQEVSWLLPVYLGIHVHAQMYKHRNRFAVHCHPMPSPKAVELAGRDAKLSLC